MKARSIPPLSPVLDPDDFLVADSAAARALGVSAMTLWRWTALGYIPVVKIGQRNFRRAANVRALQREGAPARPASAGG